MKNHRFITTYSDSESFVNSAIEFIKKHVGDKKVFCALSGGIDSSAAYLLLKKAEVNVLPVFIDHGLMRLIRGKEEKEHIMRAFPDVKVVSIREDFLPQIFGEGDAEKKRKLFKRAYSSTFNKIIKEENCDLLADGTILPDIEESFGVKIDQINETMTFDEEVALREAQKGHGFVKSQHNVEITYDIEATVQPVASLTKDQIRDVLKYLGMPDDLVYRKAFPGPALAARIVGPIDEEKLAFQKKVHDLVESSIDDYYVEKHGKSMIINEKGEQEPFQAFAATFVDASNAEVTGLVDGKRTYKTAMIITGKFDYKRFLGECDKLTGYSRVFYDLSNKDKFNKDGKFDVVIRAVNSIDARTASVTELPYDFLIKMRDNLLAIKEVRKVFVDVTKKPPATIEYV
jgi:GMP synthase (glutamine-hydrolysing)